VFEPTVASPYGYAGVIIVALMILTGWVRSRR
jgi:hypothetical protein